MPKSEATTRSLERYTPDGKGWIVAAQALADERGHAEITPLHLLARGIDRHPGIAEVFRRAGADVVELAASVERRLAELPRADGASYLSVRLLDLLARAERDADRDRAKEVTVEHILNALAQEIRGPAGEILGAFRIGPGSLKPHLGAIRGTANASSAFGGAAETPSEETPDLVVAVKNDADDPVVGRRDELRRLITILERRHKRHPLLVGEPGVGKRAIIRALARAIASGDVPPRLAGVRLLDVDVGALVSGARLRTDVDARVRRLIETSRGGGESVLVISGIDQLFTQGPSGSAVGDALRTALFRGVVRLLGTTSPEGLRKLEDRDPMLRREFTELLIEEPSPEKAGEMLRSVASRFERHHGVRVSESAVIASVSLAKRYLQDRFLPDSAVDLFDEAAASLAVETDGVPAETDRAIHRLDSVRAELASLEGVEDETTRTALLRLHALEGELVPRVLELKKELESRRSATAAVRGLRAELASARTALEAARGKDVARAGELEHVTIPDLEKRTLLAVEAAKSLGANVEPATLTEEHVARTLAARTGIPVSKMLESEAEKLLKMEERLERRVLGQSDAVRALSRAIRRGRVGLRDPRRPIGSFLFLGPSGVGKTELAKALAEFLFDDEAALTRLDMSEFMERHMAQRLLGAPPGYADSEQGGFLTEAVRRRPFSVLLFDEVEKAHEDVFNLLLQVLDDGRLTDGRGRLADFTNTVVILTSNIGSDRILGTDERLFESADGREALRDVLLGELGKFFRPEFLNRVDDVLVFRPLSRNDLARIVDIQLDQVRALLDSRHIALGVADDAKARLVELGYDPALGARPLRRAVVKYVQDPLAEKLLQKDVADGARLEVRFDGKEFVFDVA
jgi:ATP-dependent Clp protease ATP-binding subunit ClpB